MKSEQLVSACLERIAAARARSARLGVSRRRARARRSAPARPRGAAQRAARRAGRHQGRDRHRGHADRVQLADLPRPPAEVGRGLRHAAAPRRLRDPRQDRHHRVRQQPSRRRRAIRTTSAHTPGGSSSGSAAAVADRMVPLALGTQTGGSVIRPGAYCGVAACKPSFGSINRAGLKFVSESLDTIGVFARTVRGARAAAARVDGKIALARTTSLPNPVSACAARRAGATPTARRRRISTVRHSSWPRPAHAIVDFELPQGSEALFDRHYSVMGYEIGARARLRVHPLPRADQQHAAAAAREGLAGDARGVRRGARHRAQLPARSWRTSCASSISCSRRRRRARPPPRSRPPATRCSTAPGRCSACRA